VPSGLPLASVDVSTARVSAAPVDVALPARADAPRLARHLVRGVASPWLPPARLTQALVAVSEAVTNSVLHAYPEMDGGEVRVKAWASEDGLAVLVLDQGDGFDADTSGRGPRSGLGMGLRLMDSLATQTAVESRRGAGTAVLLVFHP